MMRIEKSFAVPFLLLLLLLSANSVFADFCPCPGNFNLIQIGDSIQQIIATCCAPTSQKKYKAEAPVPQIWTYYVTAPPNPANTTQGSQKMTVTFDETGKVMNITVGAYSLATTNCGNAITNYFGVNMPNSIQVGVDTLESVKKACGTAKFVEKQAGQENASLAPEIAELQYAGPPPVTLKFEEGKLTEIKK
ncbi:MAG: hypothetical protein K0R24_1054 [Gammaproteobacteria bacterium]|jgi:hypothetical protein|nr:hypothetical protein [Gammaproteobacteria bacterium]